MMNGWRGHIVKTFFMLLDIVIQIILAVQSDEKLFLLWKKCMCAKDIFYWCVELGDLL